MSKLRRSNDRKVTNAVTAGGNVAIANTFGLPSGKAFSCPGATSVCESVCYAGRIEKVRKSVSALLMHNWNLLKDATQDEAYALLREMVDEFIADCTRRGAPMLFRIHWDGDFFNKDYTKAWRRVIRDTPEVTYWVYTRSDWAVPMLKGIENLTVYFSTDTENAKVAARLRRNHGTLLATLGPTFKDAGDATRAITGRPAGRCPENTGQMPLIAPEGSACVRCDLCVHGKADILFSSSKR